MSFVFVLSFTENAGEIGWEDCHLVNDGAKIRVQTPFIKICNGFFLVFNIKIPRLD